MSYSITRTENQTSTFTIADAKYLASRIATGLTYLRLYCGLITEQHIQNLAIEAAILLKYGLLENVKYGYQKDGYWKFAISYSVNYLGQVESSDDNPTTMNPPSDLEGVTWHSFLTRRRNQNLNQADLDAIEEMLPIHRGHGVEPSSANGYGTTDDSYYRNGYGMARGQFRSY